MFWGKEENNAQHRERGQGGRKSKKDSKKSK
jgi:hypothetical protein